MPAQADGSTMIFRIVINADIQRVWRELTKTDEPQQAVFNARLLTAGFEPGSALQIRTQSGGHVLVVGKVVAFDPPHRFVHTHRFTQHEDPECRVEYTLKQLPEGVEVTLKVTELPLDTPTAKSMQKGGDMILQTLKAVAETGRPGLGTRLMYAAMARFEFMLPARTRAQNWPLR